jgi:nicotinate-nucleotide adenylyltransferase
MTRVGLFGGSFDPIHEGHVAAARHARAALGLDRVVFLPTAQPPHKPGRRFAPAARRFAMVELALLGEEGLYASDHELTGAPAYTVDTLEHFRALWPGVELDLLVGADSLAGLHTWKRFAELPRLARVVALARPGWDLGEVVPLLAPELRLAWEEGRLVAVANPPLPWASTELRAALARGMQTPPGSVHPAVLDYARKYCLYDETPPPF